MERFGLSKGPAPKQEDFSGGMTEEAAAAELARKNAEDMEKAKQKISAWTPRQQKALEFLKTLPNYAAKLDGDLTLSKVDFVEKFAKDPSDTIRAARYNEKTQSFENQGKNVSSIFG